MIRKRSGRDPQHKKGCFLRLSSVSTRSSFLLYLIYSPFICSSLFSLSLFLFLLLVSLPSSTFPISLSLLTLPLFFPHYLPPLPILILHFLYPFFIFLLIFFLLPPFNPPPLLLSLLSAPSSFHSPLPTSSHPFPSLPSFIFSSFSFPYSPLLSYSFLPLTPHPISL